MITYPINQHVQDARRRFAEIEKVAKIPSPGRSELEIVRILDNTHYEHLEDLLQFLNEHLRQSGIIGKRVLQQTDPIAFEQALSELFILIYLQNRQMVEARACVPKTHSRKNHDIDAAAGHLRAKLEVYCPVDLYGFQLMERLVSTLFKYLEVDMGYDVRLRLETSKDWYYAYEIGDERTVRKWHTQMEREVSKWFVNAREGDKKTFEGPTENSGTWPSYFTLMKIQKVEALSQCLPLDQLTADCSSRSASRRIRQRVNGAKSYVVS